MLLENSATLAKSKANITCTFLDLFSTSKVVKIRKYRVIANIGGNMIAEAKSAFSLTPKNKAAIINFSLIFILIPFFF